MNQAVHSRQVRGFTLIELLVVITIVAILGALAYPSYTNSVAKGRRADAQKALLEASQFMQRYYVANNSYADSAAKPPTLPGSLAKTSGSSGNVIYTLTVTDADQVGYKIKAVPDGSGPMSKDECGSFVLESSGKRSLEDSKKATGDCWR